MLLKKGNQYPLYIGDLQIEYPSWEEGQSLPAGWSYVIETSPPSGSSGYIVKETLPVLVDNEWQQAWTKIKLSPTEITKMIADDAIINEKYSLPGLPQL